MILFSRIITFQGSSSFFITLDMVSCINYYIYFTVLFSTHQVLLLWTKTWRLCLQVPLRRPPPQPQIPPERRVCPQEPRRASLRLASTLPTTCPWRHRLEKTTSSRSLRKWRTTPAFPTPSLREHSTSTLTSLTSPWYLLPSLLMMWVLLLQSLQSARNCCNERVSSIVNQHLPKASVPWCQKSI